MFARLLLVRLCTRVTGLAIVGPLRLRAPKHSRSFTFHITHKFLLTSADYIYVQARVYTTAVAATARHLCPFAVALEHFAQYVIERVSLAVARLLQLVNDGVR